MDFLEPKVIRQFAASMVFFTGLLVVTLGFWLWGSVFSPPSEHRTLVARGPSSVQAISNEGPKNDAIAEVKTDAKIETLALNCLREGAHVELKSGARQVRLKSNLCPGHVVNLEKSNILNRANGFEATLFQLEKGGFSSDYINLVDGQNEIVMQLVDAKGKTISAKVIISRHTL